MRVCVHAKQSAVKSPFDAIEIRSCSRRNPNRFDAEKQNTIAARHRIQNTRANRVDEHSSTNHLIRSFFSVVSESNF